MASDFQHRVVPACVVSCLLVEDLVAYLVLEQMASDPQYRGVPVCVVSYLLVEDLVANLVLEQMASDPQYRGVPVCVVSYLLVEDLVANLVLEFLSYLLSLALSWPSLPSIQISSSEALLSEYLAAFL